MMRQGSILGAALLIVGCASGAQTAAETVQTDDCPVAAIFAATDAYMETFNARDVDAWEETFHFPHVRIASGSVRVMEAAGTQSNDLFGRLAATGWDHSEWVRREIVHCSDDKAHLDTIFARYRADGSELARFQSLYVMELKDGRWGVTARSSFAP
ncbi:MAG: hypothetical protein PVI23_11390 [Maricaulaceae bacterium]|jgi:hypothetical protein